MYESLIGGDQQSEICTRADFFPSDRWQVNHMPSLLCMSTYTYISLNCQLSPSLHLSLSSVSGILKLKLNILHFSVFFQTGALLLFTTAYKCIKSSRNLRKKKILQSFKVAETQWKDKLKHYFIFHLMLFCFRYGDLILSIPWNHF